MKLFNRKPTRPLMHSSLEDFFKEYNITVTDKSRDEDTGAYNYCFDFQGGHFVADVVPSDDFAMVWFPAFYDVEAIHIDALRTTCNRINYNSRLFKVIYLYNEEKSVYQLQMSFCIDYIENKDFAERLTGCFYYQRQFIDMFTEQVKDHKDDDAEDISNMRDRRRFLISQQEMTHSGDDMSEHRFDPSACYSLGRLVDRLTSINGIQYKELTISSVADGVKVVDDAEQIASTDVLHTLIKDDATGYRTSVVTMVVRYVTPASDEDRYLTLTLTPAGIDDTSCYMRATVTDVPGDLSKTDTFDGRQPLNGSDSVLLALDRESTQKKQEEFKYMWEDAKLKLKNKEELSEEQQLLVSITNPDMGYCYYWGMKLFHQGRYHEAIAHLECAYEQVRREVYDQETFERFALLSYYIGFCYNELGDERLAFFYLDHVAGSSRIQFVEEYINALANYGDLRTFKVIDHHYEELNKAMKDGDDVPSYVEEFREFLLRRRGYVLIEFDRLDEAEALFKDLLDSPNSHDYAVDELAAIQRLRRENAQNDELPM